MSAIFTLLSTAIFNIIIGVIKIVLGLFTFSHAIMIDGVDGIFDSLSTILSAVGVKHSQKEPDDEHPLGHGNAEFVATLALSIFFLFTAAGLMYAIFSGEFLIESKPKAIAIWVMVGSIILKILVSVFIITNARRLNNTTIKAIGFESLTDLFKQVVGLIGIILYQLEITDKGDQIGAGIVAGLIAIGAITMFRDTYKKILGQSLPKEEIEKIKKRAISVKGVEGINNIIAIMQGPKAIVNIDIRVKGTISVDKGHDIASLVKEEILKCDSINYVKVHVEGHD